MRQTKLTKHIVIYADDDEDDLLLVEQAFLDYSSKVELVPFMDGRLALKYLKDLPKGEKLPCLIILDINMPGMDGKKILRELSTIKKYAKTPKILFSTSSDPADKAFAAKFEAGYITKPMNMKQLEAIVKQFVDYCIDKTKKIEFL